MARQEAFKRDHGWVEVGDGDVIGDEVTWRRMVGIWGEGKDKPRGLRDAESQHWLHLESLQSYKRMKALPEEHDSLGGSGRCFSLFT